MDKRCFAGDAIKAKAMKLFADAEMNGKLDAPIDVRTLAFILREISDDMQILRIQNSYEIHNSNKAA